MKTCSNSFNHFSFLADKFSIYVDSKKSKLSEIKITGAEASSAVFMFSMSKSSNNLAGKP